MCVCVCAFVSYAEDVARTQAVTVYRVPSDDDYDSEDDDDDDELITEAGASSSSMQALSPAEEALQQLQIQWHSNVRVSVCIRRAAHISALQYLLKNDILNILR